MTVLRIWELADSRRDSTMKPVRGFKVHWSAGQSPFRLRQPGLRFFPRSSVASKDKAEQKMGQTIITIAKRSEWNATTMEARWERTWIRIGGGGW